MTSKRKYKVELTIQSWLPDDPDMAVKTERVRTFDIFEERDKAFELYQKVLTFLSPLL